MKVVILANASGTHCMRWANALAERGVEIHLLSFHEKNSEITDRVKFHSLNSKGGKGYFLNSLQVRSICSKIAPDLVHVFYAGGYGLLARAAGLKNVILSTWGSDIFELPYRNFLTKKMVMINFSNAKTLLCTSEVMEKQLYNMIGYTKNIIRTPFGVNLNDFYVKNRGKISTVPIFGSIKGYHPRYGYDRILLAFEFYRRTADAKLILAGGGDDTEIRQLARKLKIENDIEFYGVIPYEQIPNFVNEFDVSLIFSSSESFGVAVLESLALGVPVIASNIGGIPETLGHGKYGQLINSYSTRNASSAMRYAINNRLSCDQRQIYHNFVKSNYNWDDCVDGMLDVYKSELFSK